MKSARINGYIFKFLYLLAFFTYSFSSFSQSFQTQLDSIVHSYDSLGGYNGVIIVGFGPDSIITRAYGYKDPNARTEKISVSDPFDLASLTKQFTGLAVLQLIEKKQLNENDTIGLYMPELKPALQQVTIRQLANHTNGIHDFYSLASREDTLDPKKILKLLCQLDSVVFPPGTHWGYSNSGYFLLSTIIEKITGTSFQNYCLKHILKPLGMKSACFAPECTDELTGYTAKEAAPVKYDTSSSGEAGLYASASDIISYYQTVCRDSAAWNTRFTRAEEWSDPSNEEGWNYGFGWYFTEDEKGKFRAHSGRNSGACTYVRWYEKSNLFLCLLSNKSDDFIKPLREAIADLIKKEYE